MDTLDRSGGYETRARSASRSPAQGGGIWNGVLFVPPDSPLTLVNSQVTGNVLTGSAGIALSGGGIFTSASRSPFRRQTALLAHTVTGNA
mgnify:CR=1 FL=1